MGWDERHVWRKSNVGFYPEVYEGSLDVNRLGGHQANTKASQQHLPISSILIEGGPSNMEHVIFYCRHIM